MSEELVEDVGSISVELFKSLWHNLSKNGGKGDLVTT